MNIILATRNPSKTLQIQELFAGSPFQILSLNDAGIVGEAVEDGATLEENALKKIMFVYDKLSNKAWVMADDTGLFVHALDGEPGIQAAYWAGHNVPTEETTAHALKQMEGLEDRSAMFKTVVAMMSPEGETFFFSGEVEGVMQKAARLKPQPKMPYSPLFQPHGSTKVWAEMTTEEENAISHRGLAFRKVRAFLESLD